MLSNISFILSFFDILISNSFILSIFNFNSDNNDTILLFFFDINSFIDLLIKSCLSYCNDIHKYNVFCK